MCHFPHPAGLHQRTSPSSTAIRVVPNPGCSQLGRHSRSGKPHAQASLRVRFDMLFRGNWQEWLRQAQASGGPRCRPPDNPNLEARTNLAIHLAHLGTPSAAHQAVFASPLEPGDEATLAQLRDPTRRRAQPYAPLEPSALERSPPAPVALASQASLAIFFCAVPDAGLPPIRLHTLPGSSACCSTSRLQQMPWHAIAQRIATPCPRRAGPLGGRAHACGWQKAHPYALAAIRIPPWPSSLSMRRGLRPHQPKGHVCGPPSCSGHFRPGRDGIGPPAPRPRGVWRLSWSIALCWDATLVNPITNAGMPHPRAEHTAGAALHAAESAKDATWNCGWGGHWLCVVAEVGGRRSRDAHERRCAEHGAGPQTDGLPVEKLQSTPARPIWPALPDNRCAGMRALDPDGKPTYAAVVLLATRSSAQSQPHKQTVTQCDLHRFRWGTTACWPDWESLIARWLGVRVGRRCWGASQHLPSKAGEQGDPLIAALFSLGLPLPYVHFSGAPPEGQVPQGAPPT